MVPRSKPKWLLVMTVIAAVASVVYLVSIDPYQQVRRFRPVQSWGGEALVDRSMPDDIVMFKTERCRVFKFTQDPITVFRGIGGNLNEFTENYQLNSSLTPLKRDSEIASLNLSIMESFGFPVKLLSGREADFWTIQSGGKYTCKLVIRPLTKFRFGSISDWFSR
jgi:hypothetical protein